MEKSDIALEYIRKIRKQFMELLCALTFAHVFTKYYSVIAYSVKDKDIYIQLLTFMAQ